MAITLAQSKTGAAEDATSLAIQLDDPLQSGDLIVCSLSHSAIVASSSVTADLGLPSSSPFTRTIQSVNFSIEGTASTTEQWVLANAPTTAAAPTLTVTLSAARDVAVVVEVFRGARRFAPIDEVAGDLNDGTTCSTGTTAQTSRADALCHAAWGWPSGSSKTLTDLTNGFGNILTATTGGAIRVYTAWKTVTEVGEYESTIEISSSVEATGTIIVMSEEPDGGGEPPSALEVDIIPEWYLLKRKGH